MFADNCPCDVRPLILNPLLLADYSKESLGSEEERGKDWDELEEEARKGMSAFLVPVLPFAFLGMNEISQLPFIGCL